MKINVITAFPEYLEILKNYSIIKKAISKNLVEFVIYNLRDYSKNQKIDDYVYGGGPGMLLMVEPIYNAINKIKKEDKNTKIILLCPLGKIFNQNIAVSLSKYKGKSLTFICGHYEGFDKRVYKYVDEIYSLGNFITTSGETIFSVMFDSIVRLIPNVINDNSLQFETYNDDFVEWDQYTRPRVFDNESVPEILFSGNHAEIRKWRNSSARKNKILFKKMRK